MTRFLFQTTGCLIMTTTDLTTFPTRLWLLSDVAWFRRKQDPFAEFSNFAVGFPLAISSLQIATSEHLYQAMRFPHAPHIQLQILQADSPMACKMVARNNGAHTRDDWMEIRVDVMRWVLAKKFRAHADRLNIRLRESGEKEIVEFSVRDTFWGAQPLESQEGFLRGQNVLGCLLTELRQTWQTDPLLRKQSQPQFDRAVLMGSPVR